MNFKKMVICLCLFLVVFMLGNKILAKNRDNIIKYDFNEDGIKETVLISKSIHPKTGPQAILKVFDGATGKLLFSTHFSMYSHCRIIDGKIFVLNGRLFRDHEMGFSIYRYIKHRNIVYEYLNNYSLREKQTSYDSAYKNAYAIYKKTIFQEKKN